MLVSLTRCAVEALSGLSCARCAAHEYSARHASSGSVGIKDHAAAASQDGYAITAWAHLTTRPVGLADTEGKLAKD